MLTPALIHLVPTHGQEHPQTVPKLQEHQQSAEQANETRGLPVPTDDKRDSLKAINGSLKSRGNRGLTRDIDRRARGRNVDFDPWLRDINVWSL